MAIGMRIGQLRQQAGLTQQNLCDSSGLAVSYLSRVENGHVTPSISTLQKIAKAMDVPITEFFDSDSPSVAESHCPVSVSGRCILDHPFLFRGRKPKRTEAHYTAEQLEILRLCNYLLQTGDREIVSVLEMLMKALLCHSNNQKKSR